MANEMRRDDNNIFQNDHMAFVFDTFYDRRNAVEFVVNAIGGRMDGQITNERQYGGDWNPIWDAEVGRFEGGWTVEVAIPFKSLRYRPGRAQIWGFNARRFNRWKNEWSYLTRIPSALGRYGHLPGVPGGHRGRTGVAVGIEEPRDQAVRHLGPDERSHRHAEGCRTIWAATSGST